MKTYIALLRGINVGGHRKILMIDLKGMLHTIGYQNCSTYIQSGNIIFKTNENDRSVIAQKISSSIEKYFKLQVPTLVVSFKELQKVILENPYLNEDINQLYYTFLSSEPIKENIESLRLFDFGKDVFTIKDKGVYLFYDTKASQSKLTNNIIEKKLGTMATSRNWKTIKRLEILAKEM